MNKSTIISILVSGLIIAGAFFLNSRNNSELVISENENPNINASTTPTKITSGNVSNINGVQIIELAARGGYSPRKSVAQAGIPTVIRFETSSTFDCSLSVRIPSINYSKILPQTGTTDVNLGIPLAGLFRGSCGMGMYPFEIIFKN